MQTAAYQRSRSAVRTFYPAAFLFSGGLIDVAGDCIISLTIVIDSKTSGIQTLLVTGYGSDYGEECIIVNTCCCRLEFDLTGVAYDSVVDKTITLYIGIDIACECGQCITLLFNLIGDGERAGVGEVMGLAIKVGEYALDGVVAALV